MLLENTKDFHVSMPFYEIRLSVTGACNQNCIYCGPFVDGKYTRGYGFIPLEQVREFVSELKNIINEKNLHIQITGGEPTLRKDLVEIFSILNQYVKDVGMTTNGSRMTLELADDLLKNGLSDVHIHLPSLDKDIYEKTTRARFDKDGLKNTLDSALFIKSRGGRIEFNTPVTEINISSLPSLFDFCYKNKINLKLIEELRLDDSPHVSVELIKKILADWIKLNKIAYDETKIKNRYGIIYDLDKDFFFRIAPVDETFKNNLTNTSEQILLDGRYWVGGNNNNYIFTPSYSLSPAKGTITDLKKQVEIISKKYDEALVKN
ncbi:MAG: radical SAM protein [Candidatus Moraniibacteriota bacterium]|nr:MAG: radical SAM protein [Candidatus Moranbacteria bacterium]